MKFKHLIAATIFATSLAVSFVVTPNKEAKQVEAATDIETYYSTINGTDTALLTSINGKIKNPSWVTYDGLKASYAITDKLTSSKLYDIYSDVTNYAPGSNFASSYKNPGDGYNREHTIPKSWWNDGTSKQGCDLFIVLPSDAKINGVRSNYPYGITANGASWKMDDDTYENRYGTSTATQYVSGTVFEPFDNRKGDLARIYFYAVACYWSSGESAGSVTKWTYGDGAKVFNASGKNGFVQKYLDMLLKWHHDDPVSDWEISRNTKVQGQQNNRNPFIDHPSWVDLIWGGTYPSTGANWEDTSSGEVVNGKLTPSVGITSISKNSVTLTEGQSTTISAISSNSGEITWSSSDTTVATVSPTKAASGSNVTINAVAASNTPVTITASITISGQTYSKSCNLTVNEYVPVKLATPTPTFNNSTKQVSWPSVANATSYQVKVDSGSYVTATSPYDVSGLTTGVQYTLSVIAKAGSGYTDSDAGSVTFTPTSGGGGESASFEGTYAYEDQGDTWTLSDCSDQNSYWLCPDTGNESIALISGIFTSKTITSDVVITINCATYGNGDNPTETTFKIYNSNACTTQVTAVQSGTLPTSKTFTNVIYTISQQNASTFADDLAIKITKPGKQIRLKSISVSFNYETSGGTPILTNITLNTSAVKKSFTINDVFTYAGLVVTANYSDTSSEVVESGYTVSTPDLTQTGNKTVTVTYSGKTATYDITVADAPISSITATANKTYYVGETIVSSDITVTDNNGNNVTDFTFELENYQFDYEDAASGGSLTSKTFKSAVEYSNLTCDLTVQVQRKEYETIVPTISWNKVTSVSSLSIGDVIIIADSVQSVALSTTQNDNNRGSIAVTKSNDTISWSAGDVVPQQLTLTSTANIQGAPADSFGLYTGDGYLYGAGASKNYLRTQSTNNVNGAFAITISNGIATINATASANRANIRSNYTNNPSIFSCYASDSTTGNAVEIYKKSGGTDTQFPENVANYIMYEDTNDQCATKFTIAKGHFEELTVEGRNTFMTSSDYVISTARERLEAWARHQGKTIDYDYVKGDYSISNISRIPVILNNSINNTTIIVVVTVCIAVIAIGGYFLLRKKKED